MAQAATNIGLVNTDILIIGGGVIGLSIARELHRHGVQDITVVDKGSCGREASWAAAGMLSPQAETDSVGPFFELCSRSRDMYPQFAAELLDETGFDIELDQTGTLCLCFKDEDANELLARCEWQRDAGLEVESLALDDILKLEPHLSSQVACGLRFPNDWQVENRKLVQALRAYADRNDIRVVEHTPVRSLSVENDRVAGALTTDDPVTAGHTVLATGAWTSLINLGEQKMPVAVEPVRGQIVCLDAEPGVLRHVLYSHAAYLVPRRDGRILVGSTTERVGFDGSTTEAATAALIDAANEILPSTELRVSDRWAGLRPCAVDTLPVLGTIEGVGGLTIATGHYRNGILLAPVTGKLIAERIVTSVEDPAFGDFGPGRFAAAAVASL